MKEIILASSNAGKIHEFKSLFADTGVSIIPQGSLSIGDTEETGLSFVENALIKARHAAKIGGKPAIADDSGLVVPALNGEPGIYSARYSGEHRNDKQNNQKLLARLATTEDRSAYFVCSIAYLSHENDPLPIIATGLWQGRILLEERGEKGFGYDPLFLPEQSDKTAAEIEKTEKNAISHRGKAMQAFLAQYQMRYVK
ncbi:RdgB/HAM1 family non-canonical purine NTP pyrophosphatase [Suttonella ornithocola]|uniref:dITP/XTP pyrophosphatase n=1 Tax=Suttonella ornithocola TaxID=279832 RepID=A0A380MXJ0_9GAMM|nr:RdgB/HAM1 family non-canonical purine NTP pyrophosphatase [Suttonella ornithocola]SUO96421.1 Non-canonical purine NTP pyrophosphatase [Suttonella ornithocola]